jgi:Ca-activated chloride channel family protein
MSRTPLVLTFLAILLAAARAADRPGQGQLLGPEGRVFPLEHTDVSAEVSGSVARVVVRQTFRNPFEEAIEAIYVFPLPDRAAVDDMTIEIGPRRIRGEIREREEAKKVYEAAKRAGKTAALLTQERPNVFTQNLANVLPGETIVVEIRYAETLAYEKGTYTLVFPMVVGPRFHPPGAVPDAANVPSEPGEYLKPGERSGHEISLAVALDAGVPIERLACGSHAVDVSREGETRATVAIRPADAIPNKDFTLSWSVAGEAPKTAVLAHRTGVGGFFTLMIQPEKAPDPGLVMPREVFLVVDCSGSMNGKPIETAKEVVRRTLKTLGPADTFQILKFSQTASGLSEAPLPVTAENVEKGLAYIDAMSGHGGTYMLEGMRAALRGPRSSERLRILHFLTDGYIGNETQILAEVKKLLDGARIFPLGVGSSPNRYLIDRLARVGRGAASYIRVDATPERVAKEVARFVDRVRRATLVDIEIEWAGLPVKEILPAKIPDLFVGQPVVVHGVFDHAAGGQIVLRGRRGGRPYQQSVRLVLPEREERNGALAVLWARAKIADLALMRKPGEEEAVKEKITNLALEFRLMSAYTAFVAVEERVVVEGGAKKTVREPVPLPDGTTWKGFFGDDLFSDAPFDGPGINGRIGIGGGAGGSFGGRGGRRSLRAAGGGATEGAVDLGHEWQKRNQAPDGSWESDPEATGAALLALLGGGETHKTGRYRTTVKTALRWLKQTQTAAGAFPGRDGRVDVRGHAVAALAMCETVGLTGSPLFKTTAQKAVDHLASVRERFSGWGSDGSPDVETTFWAVAALRAATKAGLQVDEFSVKGALGFLDAMTDETTGAVTPAKGRPATHRAAILAQAARMLCGQKEAKGPDATKWGDGPPDPLYALAASIVTFRRGGEEWKAWNRLIKKEILDRQVTKDARKGSWNPPAGEASLRERVITTALNQLACQVYYRYSRTFGIR